MKTIRQNKIFVKALVQGLSFTIAFLATVPAMGNDPIPPVSPKYNSGTSYCSSNFKLFSQSRSPERLAAKIKAIEEDLDRLRAIKIDSLFKNKVTIQGGKNKGTYARVVESEIGPFKIEFDHIIDQQARLDPEWKKELPGFREWMRSFPESIGPYPTLNNAEIDAYIKEGGTLGDFANDTFAKYILQKNTKESLAAWARGLQARTLKHIAKSVWRGGTSKLKTFMAVFWGSTLAYQFNAPLNALFYGFLEPLKRYAGIDEKNLKDNATEWAEALKNVFANFEGGKEKYQEALNSIGTTMIATGGTNLNSLERDEGRAKLSQQEMAFDQDLTKFSKSLDSADKERHTRQRDFLRSLIPGMQISETNFNVQRAELRAIDEAIKNRGTPATPQELSDMQSMKESMKESEIDIARALAMWKAYKFTLAKDQKDSIRDLDVQFNPVYLNYVRFKDLDVYKNQILLQVTEATNKLKEFNK